MIPISCQWLINNRVKNLYRIFTITQQRYDGSLRQQVIIRYDHISRGHNSMLAFTIHLLRPLTCSDLELISETINSFRCSWQGSLDRGSAHYKASIYSGQHNTEKHGHTSIPQSGFKPTIRIGAIQDYTHLRPWGQWE